jgi:hypothetical protein
MLKQTMTKLLNIVRSFVCKIFFIKQCKCDKTVDVTNNGKKI